MPLRKKVRAFPTRTFCLLNNMSKRTTTERDSEAGDPRSIYEVKDQAANWTAAKKLKVADSLRRWAGELEAASKLNFRAEIVTGRTGNN